MSYAERVAAAVREIALATLADPSASPEDIQRAKRALLGKRTDVSSLADHELDCWLYLASKLKGEPYRGSVHEMACSAQTFADERRDEHASAPGDGRPVPGCRRCSFAEDADLAALREAIRLDDEQAKIIEPEVVGQLPPGRDRG